MTLLLRTAVFSLLSFSDLMALTTLLGSSWLHVWSIGRSSQTFPASVHQRLRQLYLLCLAVLVASSFGILILRSMEMGGVGFSEIAAVVPTVLRKTHFGGMWLLRLAGLLVAWTIWGAARSRMASRLWPSGLLLAATIIAFSRSGSGHLADFGDFSASQLGDWLHLCAVSCWAGTLVAIAIVFPPSSMQTEEIDDGLHQLADRFYFLFGPLLAVLVFTGWHASWLLVGSFEALAVSPYGWLLCLKLLLFIILVRRYIVPPSSGHGNRHYITDFLRRTRKEAFWATAIILCVAILIHRVPARHQAHLAESGKAEHHAEHVNADSPQEIPIVTLSTNPAQITVGEPVELSIRFTNRDGNPLQGLTIIHERILHAVVIGADLQVFAHIHPEDLMPISREMIRQAVFPLRYTFPRPGEYLIGVDFAKDDEPYSETFRLTAAAPTPMQDPIPDFATRKTFDGYQVSLAAPGSSITVGTETQLKYEISKNGKDVSDLEPYLGAAMHLAIVSTDLQIFIHTHGVLPGTASHAGHHHLAPPPASFGPAIEADVLFPSPGYYKIFAQFKHHGRVVLTDFMVNVH